MYGSQSDFALVKLTAVGELDTNFDLDGKVTANFAAAEFGTSLARLPDGDWLLTGSTTANGTYDFAAVRYQPNGALRTTWGTGGRVVVDLAGGEGQSNDVVVLADGSFMSIKPSRPL